MGQDTCVTYETPIQSHYVWEEVSKYCFWAPQFPISRWNNFVSWLVILVADFSWNLLHQLSGNWKDNNRLFHFVKFSPYFSLTSVKHFARILLSGRLRIIALVLARYSNPCGRASLDFRLGHLAPMPKTSLEGWLGTAWFRRPHMGPFFVTD